MKHLPNVFVCAMLLVLAAVIACAISPLVALRVAGVLVCATLGALVIAGKPK